MYQLLELEKDYDYGDGNRGYVTKTICTCLQNSIGVVLNEIVSTKVIASTSSSRLIADYFKTYLENLRCFEIYEICLPSRSE